MLFQCTYGDDLKSNLQYQWACVLFTYIQAYSMYITNLLYLSGSSMTIFLQIKTVASSTKKFWFKLDVDPVPWQMFSWGTKGSVRQPLIAQLFILRFPATDSNPKPIISFIYKMTFIIELGKKKMINERGRVWTKSSVYLIPFPRMWTLSRDNTSPPTSNRPLSQSTFWSDKICFVQKSLLKKLLQKTFSILVRRIKKVFARWNEKVFFYFFKKIKNFEAK